MKKLNYKKTILPQITNLVIIILFATVTVIIVSLKIGLLSNWLYSSDLFTYDTFLQEALKGNFGLEYTYGNSLGDHAYLGLFLLVPLKLILNGKMVYFLVLITPLLFLSACFALYYFVSKHKFLWFEKLLVFIPLIFLLDIIKGNTEGIYGFHPDTGMGFLLLIIALLLETLKNKDGQTRIKPLIWILVLIFVLTKEEMALLGILFFGILFLFKRKKIYAGLLLLSLVVFAIEIYITTISKTPLNRGNGMIVKDFMAALQNEGLFAVLGRASFNSFWNYITLYCITFIVLLFAKRNNATAIALFVAGLFKAVFSFLVQDYSFSTWHGFPALAMFVGAIAILVTNENRYRYGSLAVWVVLSALSIISILNLRHDLIYRKSSMACIHATKYYKEQVEVDLNELKSYIDKDKVVALNTYLALNFADGYRYAFYPRGVEWPPSEIAYYIIADKTTDTIRHLVASSTESLVKTGKIGYDKIFENNSFTLFKRDEPLDKNAGHCKIFIERYGNESLGIKQK